jgi:hypothetical protein
MSNRIEKLTALHEHVVKALGAAHFAETASPELRAAAQKASDDCCDDLCQQWGIGATSGVCDPQEMCMSRMPGVSPHLRRKLVGGEAGVLKLSRKVL